jgi:phenylacetate-CoA ligase
MECASLLSRRKAAASCRTSKEMTSLEKWVEGRLKVKGRVSLPRLQEYQIAQFRETVAYVKLNSRFYKQHLQDIDPDSIQSMKDIESIPFTEPEMLAGHFNDFLCVSPRDISRIVTLSTSGTTGRPKRIAFTPEDQELIVDFFHHGMRTLVQSSDRVLIFMPGETEGSVGDLLSKSLSRLGCESILFGPVVDYGNALKTLLDAKPDCAVGIPSQLFALSRISANRTSLKSVLLSADCSSPAVIDSLKLAWGCEVYDHYGMTEMGLGGALECSAHQGYHMRDADLLFEIIDPVGGRPVKDEEYGEIVFSTLTRRGMPLIRYRTGDWSRLLTPLCPCGSVLKRMERISGRYNQAVQLQDGSRISMGELDEIMYREPCVSAYSAELRMEGGCDCLVLTVASSEGHAIESERIAAELCSRKLKLVVRVGDPGYFTNGTAKRFISDKRN